MGRKHLIIINWLIYYVIIDLSVDYLLVDGIIGILIDYWFIVYLIKDAQVLPIWELLINWLID